MAELERRASRMRSVLEHQSRCIMLRQMPFAQFASSNLAPVTINKNTMELAAFIIIWLYGTTLNPKSLKTKKRHGKNKV